MNNIDFLKDFTASNSNKKAVNVVKSKLNTSNFIELEQNNIKKLIDTLDEGYMSLLPRKRLKGENKRFYARGEHAFPGQYIAIDIDKNKDKYGKDKPLDSEVMSAIHARIMSDPILGCYNAIVCSGGGLHIYYKLTNRVTTINKWEHYSDILLDMFDGVYEEFDDDIERDTGTSQKSRFLRMPGTMNYKYNKGVRCEVLHYSGKSVNDHFIEKMEELHVMAENEDKAKEQLAHEVTAVSNTDVLTVMAAIGKPVVGPPGKKRYLVDCPFEGHPEGHASFSIFKMDSGTYIWKCFGSRHPKEYPDKGSAYTLALNIYRELIARKKAVPPALNEFLDAHMDKKYESANERIRALFNKNKSRWLMYMSEEVFDEIVTTMLLDKKQYTTIVQAAALDDVMKLRANIANTCVLMGLSVNAKDTIAFAAFSIPDCRAVVTKAMSTFKDSVALLSGVCNVTRQGFISAPHINVRFKPRQPNLWVEEVYAATGKVKRLECNLWQDTAPHTRAKEGAEIPPDIDMLLNNLFPIPNKKRMFLLWLAYMYQTGDKPPVAWLIYGPQGTGKDFFAKYVLSHLFGEENIISISSQDISDPYGSVFVNKRIVVINESTIEFKEAQLAKNVLKTLITEDSRVINVKYEPRKRIDTPFGLLIFTNEVKGIKMEAGDRRFLVSQTSGPLTFIPRFNEMVDEVNVYEYFREKSYDFAEYLEKLPLIDPVTRRKIRSQDSMKAIFTRSAQENDDDKNSITIANASPTEALVTVIMNNTFTEWIANKIETTDLSREEAMELLTLLERTQVELDNNKMMSIAFLKRMCTLFLTTKKRDGITLYSYIKTDLGIKLVITKKQSRTTTTYKDGTHKTVRGFKLIKSFHERMRGLDVIDEHVADLLSGRADMRREDEDCEKQGDLLDTDF